MKKEGGSRSQLSPVSVSRWNVAFLRSVILRPVKAAMMQTFERTEGRFESGRQPVFFGVMKKARRKCGLV